MLMYRKMFIWTTSIVVVAFILSMHVLQETLLNLFSSLFAVLIGSFMGVVLFVLFLNFLEKKDYYLAHVSTFESFANYFNISTHNDDHQNSAQRSLNRSSKVKLWMLRFYKTLKITALKLVYQLVNSPMIRHHTGNPAASENDSSFRSQSIYELIRPYGQTPDEMLTSAYVSSTHAVCVSKKIDEIMHKVFEYTYRDYIETWYEKVSCDRGNFHRVLQADYWDVVKAFSERLSRLDTVNLIMNRFVSQILGYMEELRTTAKANKNDDKPTFTLHPCLRDRNTELTYLRHVSDYILILTLPPESARISSLRYILREVLAGLSFLPMVETMCDPDYINLTILMYFQSREAAQEEQTRAYAYAATYEEFIKIINECKSVSGLSQIRYRIMTEIIHATTISSLKKDQSKAGKARSMDKGELLLNRDLKRYINQCQVAKQQCEKKIRLLGGDDYGGKYSPADGKSGFIESQLLSFEEIMNSAITRSYFLKYLRKVGKASLLKFWNEAEVIRNTNLTGKNLAKIVSHLYQNYILPESPDQLPFEVEKSLVQGMQDCVMGNKLPVDFFSVQKQIYDIMEKDHYPSFVVSDIYSYQLMPEIVDHDIESHVIATDIDVSKAAFGSENSSDASLKRLKSIEEKLEYKAQALESLKSTKKVDPKVKDRLFHDINVLQNAKWRQQLHMERTDAWWENMGKWNASIEKVHVSEDEGPAVPLYTIIVQCSGVPFYKTSDDISGWVMVRNLNDFHRLHHSLKDCSPWLKKQSLPKLPMFRLKGFSDKFLNDSKNVVDDYLNKILQITIIAYATGTLDIGLCQARCLLGGKEEDFKSPQELDQDETLQCSQIVYSFLSPGPDVTNLSTQDDVRRLSGVKLAENIGGFLKRFPKDVMDRVIRQAVDEDDPDDLPDDDESNARDSVAEPLYKLISEIFELHGLFRFLRRSLIVFVRVAFGRSINRQVRDVSDWLVSEPMVSFYLQTFLDSMWPGGQLAKPARKRTEDEKLQTKLELQVKLLQNIPEALNSLVGQENAKRGILKVFHALQDKRLNKHLFYTLLAESMEELFPEILRCDE